MSVQETAGVDFSAARPVPAALAADGFRFIVGYLKPTGISGAPHPWELRATDLASYRGAGLGVLAVYESTGDTWRSAGAAGVLDGRTAVARAAAIGYPAGCPVFAAVDSDPGAYAFTAAAYLAAFVDTVEAAGWHGGGYGSLSVVEALEQMRPAALRWQTAGWSGGNLSPHAHLYQRANTRNWPVIAGTDENIVCAPLPCYGGLLLPGGAGLQAPAPAPAPAPVPAPAPAWDAIGYVRALRGQRGDTGPIWQRVQEWGNATFPAYCKIAPTAPAYGPATTTFLAALAHRAAADPRLPGSISRAGLRAADGLNVGPNLSATMAFYGLPRYLERVGFRG